MTEIDIALDELKIKKNFKSYPISDDTYDMATGALEAQNRINDLIRDFNLDKGTERERATFSWGVIMEILGQCSMNK